MRTSLSRRFEAGEVPNPSPDLFPCPSHMSRVNGRKVSLESMCEELEVPYYRQDKLHNAGNDAFFTMAAFLEMCVDSD